MSSLVVMKGDEYSDKRLAKWLREDEQVVAQIKRDEFRCLVQVEWDAVAQVYRVDYTSAQGKPLHNLQCWDGLWLSVAMRTGMKVFDCGVLVNDSFDLTRRTVRASKKTYDLSGTTKQVVMEKRLEHYRGPLKAHFWLYDLPQLKTVFSTRLAGMADIALNFPELCSKPETWYISSEQALMELYDAAVEMGFEGMMVKRIDYQYEPKRKPDLWMKLKPYHEVDAVIVGCAQGKGKYSDTLGSLEVKTEDGELISVSGMTDAERDYFWFEHDFLTPQWATIGYMGRDTKGGFRHPRFVRLHAEKNL